MKAVRKGTRNFLLAGLFQKQPRLFIDMTAAIKGT